MFHKTPSLLTQYEPDEANKKTFSQLKYSINLLWLNTTLNESQECILPASCGRGMTVDDCLFEVYAWKKSNPEAEVNLWVDSFYVTPQAIQNTQDKLVAMGAMNKIFLRDIRSISIVKNNPDSFSDNLPIYFRIDLMKFIICLSSIENDHNEGAIFTDFLVGNNPHQGGNKLTKDELFSSEILIDLNKCGLKIGIDAFGKVENQFLQVIACPKLLDALKFIINLCLNTAVTTLKIHQIPEGHADRVSPKRMLTSLGNYIYDSLLKPIFLNLCVHGINDLKVKEETFDPTRHGYDLFGNTVYSAAVRTAIFNEQTIKLKLCREEEETNFSDLYQPNFREAEKIEAALRRNVYSDKQGLTHVCDYKDLIPRKPADGTDQYKCILIPISCVPAPTKQNGPG